MNLRFSDEGPAFPSTLVDAMIAGEVVFLCGAGISAPQLPGFKALVDRCYAALHLERDRSEAISYDLGRYEEVLGSLSRRIVDPDELVRTVSGLVALPSVPDLANHRTVLRLSRDLEGRPTVVTTNFDTLIEHAWLAEGATMDRVAAASVAGQSLPSPGSAAFHGILHVHGRIADETVGVDASPLVMTSADYGDAYMRSGWVSRFLFDLCRCRTVVLVGYSAGDAPVRYFLNVLEADRARFPDLRPVYALDAADGDEDDAIARWSTLAVKALLYRPATDDAGQLQRHLALWRDLALLADLVERPKATRRRMAKDHLARPFAVASERDRDWLAWLFAGRRDLFDLVIDTAQDSAWLDFLAERAPWTEREADLVTAAWIARDFQDRARFDAALRWTDRRGRVFRTQLAFRLQHEQNLPEPWLRAWRLLASGKPPAPDLDDRSYAVQQSLAGSRELHADLRTALRILTPDLVLEPNRSEAHGLVLPDPPERLRDLTWARLRLADGGGVAELFDALIAHAPPAKLLDLGTAALRDALSLAADADLVGVDFDEVSSSLPSVEPHGQNAHRDGVVRLVELLTRVLPDVALVDAALARRRVEDWRAMPGSIGVRLWLHALRHADLYDAATAIEGLLELPRDAFWGLRREVALLIRDRAGGADAEAVKAVEQRILVEGRGYFQRYEVEPGEVDWRDAALDQAVWLRLRMLAAAGTLSREGTEALAAIVSRHPDLERDVADRDYFGSYSYGARFVVGDASAIVAAPEDKRLDVALEARNGPGTEASEGWRAFCEIDPSGALAALRKGPLKPVNAPLWRDLSGVLAHGSPMAEMSKGDLIRAVFEELAEADDDFLERVVSNLADLYQAMPLRDEALAAAWWPRLFRAAAAIEGDTFDPDRDIVDKALNSATGRLTEALVDDLDRARKDGQPASRALIAHVTVAATAAGYAGTIARTCLLRQLGFIRSFDVPEVTEALVAAVTGDGAEGQALREVLVTQVYLSAATTRLFGQAIVEGAVALTDEDRVGYAAVNILSPTLAAIWPHDGTTPSDAWGIDAADTARTLRDGSRALRDAALVALTGGLTNPEAAQRLDWRTAVGPVLHRVWPRERRFQHPATSRRLAALVVAAGDAFTDALRQLLPYIAPLEGHGGAYEIKASSVPESYPADTLDLLWRLFGPESQVEVHDLPEILDRLVAADVTLERDRRLQWLEQRYPRYL